MGSLGELFFLLDILLLLYPYERDFRVGLFLLVHLLVVFEYGRVDNME